MNMPVGVRCWRNMVRRCCSLSKLTFEHAGQCEKAVLSEKKESRSTYTFLIDIARQCVYRVGGHYFFTVHELGIDEFWFGTRIDLNRPTGKMETDKTVWCRTKPIAILQHEERSLVSKF